MTTTAPQSEAHVVLVGRLGSSIEERELPSGDTVTTFTVVVDRAVERGRGGGTRTAVKVDAIACQTFRSPVVRRLGTLEPGQWVQAEGTLRRRFWRTGAALNSIMEVDVSSLRAVR